MVVTGRQSKDVSRRFQECVEDDFLTQPVRQPTREGVALDLLLANRAGLVGDVMAGGHLGHSDLEMIEFSIDGEVRRGLSRTAILDFLLEGRLWPLQGPG